MNTEPMKLPNNPTVTRIKLKPIDGYSATLIHLSKPIELDEGSFTHFVVESFGLESVLGDDNRAVFPSDPEGRILEHSNILEINPFFV